MSRIGSPFSRRRIASTILKESGPATHRTQNCDAITNRLCVELRAG
jgi:hypothetical protein